VCLKLCENKNERVHLSNSILLYFLEANKPAANVNFKLKANDNVSNDYDEKLVIRARTGREINFVILTLCDQIYLASSASTFGWLAAYLVSRNSIIYYNSDFLLASAAR